MKPSQKPRNWEKHRSRFTQSGWQSSYLLHQCKQERCLHNCMEKWEEPASLGSCVWKNEAPSALLEKKKNLGSGKWQEQSQDSGGEKYRGRKKSSFEMKVSLRKRSDPCLWRLGGVGITQFADGDDLMWSGFSWCFPLRSYHT